MLWLGLTCASLASPPVSAQELTRAALLQEIWTELAKVDALISQGKRDESYEVLEAISWKSYNNESLIQGTRELYLPNLAMARYYRHKKDYAESERFAAAVIAGMADDGWTTDPARIEALAILGLVLRMQNDHRQAEVVLRSAVDISEGRTDVALHHRNALYHLSFVAIQNKAKDTLEVLDRTVALFDAANLKSDLYRARLVNAGLQYERTQKADRIQLVKKAREFQVFLTSANGVSDQEMDKFLGLIAILYFEANQFEDAEKILERRIAYLQDVSPNSRGYFWAVQNLAELYSSTKRYDASISLASQALADIELNGGGRPVQKATFLRGMGHAYRRQDNPELAQKNYRAAYAAMREVRAATHPTVLNIRSYLDVALIDPEAFEFAKEIGVETAKPLGLSSNGETILEGFFRGKYVDLENRLLSLQSQGQSESLLEINLALYFALIGEVEQAQAHLKRARQLSVPEQSELRPTDPIFDIIDVMSHVWGVEWQWNAVGPTLDRFLQREDITPQHRAIGLVLQMSWADLADQPHVKFAAFRTLKEMPPESWGQGMWRIWIMLSLVDPYYRHGAYLEAEAHLERTLRVIQAHEAPHLAVTLATMFRLNSAAGLLSAENTQSVLAGVIKQLTTMLPEGHIWQVVGMVNYADSLFETGQSDDALKTIDRAIAMYRNGKYYRNDVLAVLTVRQANMLEMMGDSRLAMVLFRQSFEEISTGEASSKYVAAVLANYCYALFRVGEYQQAIDVAAPYVQDHDFVASLAPEDQVLLMQTLGHALNFADQPQKALLLYEQAERAIPSPEYQSGLLLSGLLYERVGAEFALGLLGDAYQNVRRSNELYFGRLRGLAKSSGVKVASNAEFDRLRVADEAYIGWEYGATLKADAAVVAEIRDNSFLATQNLSTTAAGKAMEQAAARVAANDVALSGMLRTRQELADVLAQLQGAFSEFVLQDGAASEAKVAETQSKIDVIREQISDIDQKLLDEFPAFQELTDPLPMSRHDVQSILGDREAMVLTLSTESYLYVWAIGKRHSAWHRADLPRADLDSRVRTLRAMLDVTSDNRSAESLDAGFVASVAPFDRAMAYELYLDILAPVAHVLEDIDHLISVVDAPLNSLPLAVLLTSPPQGADTSADDLRQSDWLIRKYAMSTLPNVSSLRSLRRARPEASPSTEKHPFTGFGNPVLGYQDDLDGQGVTLGEGVVTRGVYEQVSRVANLAPLPFTETELRAQADVMGVGSESIFLASNATEARVKQSDLSNTQVLAFATHGLVSGGLVGLEEPALVFTPPMSPTSTDDALLTASEAAQLKLSADLIILSACNTAAGDGTPGAEGLSGLARSFIFAGARSILVSHWPVDDYATSALTTGMLSHLQAETPVGRSKALQASILELLDNSDDNRHSHPRFWAPFVLVGEGAID